MSSRTPRASPAAASATQSSTARQISARLAIGERDPVGREARGEGRRRWLGLDVGEARRRPIPTKTSRRPAPRPTTRCVGRASSTSFAMTMPTIGAPSSASTRSPRPAAREPLTKLGDPAGLDLDRLGSGRSRRAAARRPAGRRGVASASAPAPAPYSRIVNAPGGRAPSRRRRRVGRRRPEDRVGLRRGQEVAAATRPRGGGPVVARDGGRRARAP